MLQNPLVDRFRYVIIGISLVILTLVFENPLILNFTVICMKKEVNGTKEALFTDSERSWLFSVVAAGNICATLIVTQLTRILGGRMTFTIYGTISAVSTLLMPWFVSLGFSALVVVRILQGAGAGMTLAAIGTIANAWSSITATGFVISVISSYVQIGPMYGMPMASIFCESSLGWQATFYLQGILTLVVTIVFFFIYKDSPRCHSWVSQKELIILEKNKSSNETSKESRFVPYSRIFSDFSVWGIFFCAFGSLLSQQIFHIYGAVYLNQILQLTVEQTGFSAFIANLICLFLKLAVSPISDYATCVNQKNRAKIIMTVAHMIVAGAFFVLAFIDHRNQILGQICYMITVIVSSLQSVGFMKTNQLANRQYAYVVMAIVACINCSIVLMLPGFMTIVAPNNSINQWHTVFWIIGGIVVITTVIYDFTAKADPRPWTVIEDSESSADVISHTVSSKKSTLRTSVDSVLSDI